MDEVGWGGWGGGGGGGGGRRGGGGGGGGWVGTRFQTVTFAVVLKGGALLNA